MATEWISPTWRMPEESNQSKFENYSLDFDGSAEAIDCTNSSIFNLTTAMTLSVWINPTVAATDKFILAKRWTTPSYQIATAGSINPQCSVWIGSTRYDAIGTTTLAAGTWYHIVGTFDGSNVRVYLNGALEATTAASGSLDQTTDIVSIGKGLNNNAYNFNGKITCATIYDSVLTTDQITALYNSGTPVNPMALTPLPVAYYPLGGSSTGSADDPATTLTIPNSSVPSATVFDFIPNDYINLGNSPELRITPNLTVSAWFKTSTSQVGKFINRDGLVSGTRDYALYQNGTNLQFWVSQSGNITETVLTSTGFTANDGNWHHAVGVCNGTNIELYIDGVLNVSGTNSISGINTSTYINEIGSRTTGTGNFFNGELSNIQIWDTALELSDVEDLYNNGVPYTGTQPQAANLKGWWKMNVDTSTWNGTDWIIGDSTANYTTALNFDGTSDSFSIASPYSTLANKSAFTLSFWFKQIDFLYNRTVLHQNNGIKFSTTTNNKLSGNIYTFTSKTLSSNTFSENEWQHFMLIYDGSSLKLYQNGDVADTDTGVSGNTPNVTGLLAWASRNNLSAEFNECQISNIAVWDTDQTTEVSNIYNNGTPATSYTNTPNNWYKLDNTTTGIEDAGSAGNNGTNNGATEVNTLVSTLNGLSDGMTTANLVTSDLTRSIPYSSYSMFFDGIDDVVQITRNANLEPTNISISCWVNVTASGSHASGYFVSKIHTSGASVSYGIYKPATPTFVINVGGVIKSSPAYGTDIQGQGWHHLVGTYDGANIRLYVNGAEVGSGTAETGSIDYTTEDAYIGSFEPSSLEIDGNISNAAIFTSALTQDQILTIYNGGVPNSISSLSPVSWWSLAGDSYFNGTNWICPDLGSGGNNGTSGGMGGTELVGDGPGSTANGIATSMNIPGNLQGNAPNSSKNAFSINMTAIDRIDYDAEAKAFINAAGITDATQQLAIKTLVSSLQSDNLWTNMKAIYPMVGGTSTTHKYNLRNPLDSDAGFRLVFDGGWTHSATGATPGGVNGRANSHLVPSNDISSKDAMSFGYYSRDTSDANGLGYDMGSYQAGDISILVIKYVNLLWYSINQNTYTKPANTNTDGFFVSNRSASNAIQVYRNGSSFHTAANLSTDLSAADFGIGGIYGTPGYGNKECAFAFIYDGSLDATQNLNLYNAVQAFNTTLGRQV